MVLTFLLCIVPHTQACRFIKYFLKFLLFGRLSVMGTIYASLDVTIFTRLMNALFFPKILWFFEGGGVVHNAG